MGQDKILMEWIEWVLRKNWNSWHVGHEIEVAKYLVNIYDNDKLSLG